MCSGIENSESPSFADAPELLEALKKSLPNEAFTGKL
jgi:hypothetical protein